MAPFRSTTIKLLNNNKRNILFFVMFTCSFFFLIWKAPFGFGFNDEPYIISVAHRLIFGDGLLSDEWFPSQIVGFLLYPIVSIYHGIRGNMDNSLLFFRYCYVSMWTLTALFAYKRLRNYPLIWLFIIFFYLYAPLDYMTLSYNSIALSSLLIVCVILLTSYKMQAFLIAGIFFAFAVLCCPPLLAVYLAYSIAAFFIRKSKNKPIYLTGKNWLMMTIGSAFIAIFFFYFVFSRATLNDLLLAYKWMFIADEHERTDFFIQCYLYFHTLYSTFPIQSIISLILLPIMLIDRARTKRQYIYVTVMCTGLITSLYTCINEIYLKFNYILGPFSLFGICIFILTKKKDWNLFFIMYCTGISYSFSLFYTSNLKIMAICHGLSLSTFTSLIFTGEWLREKLMEISESQNLISWLNNKILIIQLWISRIFLCIVLIISSLQVVGLFYIRLNRNYYDEYTPKLTTCLDKGVYKGIYTTAKRAEIYYNVINAIENMQLQSDEKLFINAMMPWAYLQADREYSGFSAWFNIKVAPETYFSKQLAYWDEKPEKIPDAAYLSKDSAFSLELLSNIVNLDDYIIIEHNTFWICIRQRAFDTS